MAKLSHLKFNDPAPILDLLSVEGKPVRLSSLWKKQAVILAFARHFGCPQCKQIIETLASISVDLESNGLFLVIVTQGTPEAAKVFLLGPRVRSDLSCRSGAYSVPRLWS